MPRRISIMYNEYDEDEKKPFAVTQEMYNKAPAQRQKFMEILDDKVYYDYIKIFLNLDTNRSGEIGGNELSNTAVDNVFLGQFNKLFGTSELSIEKYLIYAAYKGEEFFKDKTLETFRKNALKPQDEKGLGFAMVNNPEKGPLQTIIDWL